jgi:hypothetical protein
MWDRLRSYLSRPAPDAPAHETLRWVRRVAIATMPVGVLVFVQAWASDAVPLWAAAALVALIVASPASLTLAIRATEKQAAMPGYRQPTPDQIRTRERRAMYATLAVLCVSMPVFGYFIEGVATAVFVFVFAVLGSGASIWWQRRMAGRFDD